MTVCGLEAVERVSRVRRTSGFRVAYLSGPAHASFVPRTSR